jgi:predicted pyridoxine 5'-phosphate oxidase superfamily flavin-nucleotide-binding protein
MVRMPPEIKDVVAKQKPLPFATADKNGKPNVAFVTMWKILDDETLLFVDNAYNKTRLNIQVNPNVAIVAYDSEVKKSYQIKGTVEIETSGERYKIAKEMADVKKQAGRAAVIFKVKEIYDSSIGAGGKKIA